MRSIFSFVFVLYSLMIFGQQWEKLGDTPFLKHHCNGFGVNGKAYILQGVGNDSETNVFWEYDPKDDRWSKLDSFPGSPRGYSIGVDYDGKYYYGFGFNNEMDLNDLWVFDPSNKSFTQLASCPCVGRYHPALIAVNGKVFMGAGSTENGDLDDWWEYDIATNTWSEKPNIPGGVRHHVYQFYIDSMVYVGGGHVDNWIAYNPKSEVWKEINDLPKGRVAGTQFSHGGFGYLIGGDTTDHGSLDDEVTFMQYDAKKDTWKYLPPLPNGTRWAPSNFIIDDILYFFGGMFGPAGEDRSVWKIDLNALNGVSSSDENLISEDIKVFPNPANKYLNINLDFLITSEVELSIYSTNGNLVKKDVLRANYASIDIQDLSSGTYLIVITSNKDIYRSTFSKQ